MYECKRCKFTTKYKNDMRRHLEKLIKCGKDLDSYQYSDEELYNLSLILNKDDSINEKNKSLMCEYCNKIYSRIDSLNRHRKTNCKNNIMKNGTENDSSNNVINIQNINNIHNHNHNQNIFIIKNDNFNLKPFNEEWSIEHIDNYLKLLILLSKTKYTDFLSEIMKNKENLNVIVDENCDSGLVYKNDKELYVKIKLKEILEQSMIKINGQLQKLFDECLDNDTNIESEFIRLVKNEKNINIIKFNDYIKDLTVKKHVDSLLVEIFNKNKDNALQMANELLQLTPDNNNNDVLSLLNNDETDFKKIGY